MSSEFLIYSVSDATGELAKRLAVAAARQFENIQYAIIPKPRSKTKDSIDQVINEVKNSQGVILFTMVSQELRRYLLDQAKLKKVVAVDVMGPALDTLSHYFHRLPSDEPGLQYRQTTDYYQRTEAIEFTVRHDEGAGLDDLDQADIIILGISRASKTPLSIYLAYQGYRCANIPVVVDIPLPNKILELKHRTIVGLTIEPQELINLRSSRLKNLGRSDKEDYANRENIEKEVEYALSIYQTIPNLKIIDVTGKAIEELAIEISQLVRD